MSENIDESLVNTLMVSLILLRVKWTKCLSEKRNQVYEYVCSFFIWEIFGSAVLESFFVKKLKFDYDATDDELIWRHQ